MKAIYFIGHSVGWIKHVPMQRTNVGASAKDWSKPLHPSRASFIVVWWWCLIIISPCWRNSPGVTLSIVWQSILLWKWFLLIRSWNWFVFKIAWIQSELVPGIRTSCYRVTFHFSYVNSSAVRPIGINQTKQIPVRIFTQIYSFIMQNATVQTGICIPVYSTEQWRISDINRDWTKLIIVMS